MSLPRLRYRPRPLRESARLIGWTAAVFVLLLSSCAPEPRPLRYGEDRCVHCEMLLTDPRFGAELVTTTGKTHPFDAVECLAAYLEEGAVARDEVHSLWVTDMLAPDSLIALEEAVFLRSASISSPMGLHLAAFSNTRSASVLIDRFGGEILSWNEVRALVREEEFTASAHEHGPHARSREAHRTDAAGPPHAPDR